MHWLCQDRNTKVCLQWSVKQDLDFCSVFLLAAALAQILPNNVQAWECSPSAAWMWPSGAVEGKGDATMQTWVRPALVGLQDV